MIYVISHKENNKVYNDDHKVLYVGDLYEKNYKDDNINHLNPYINELTGLYHMWKHCNDEYIGLAHYRRVFIDGENNIITLEKAKKILKSNDIICTKDYTVPINIIQWLYNENDRDRVKLEKYYNILCDKVPGVKNYFEKNAMFNPKNMFICKHETLDKYCQWLFPIVLPMVDQLVKEDLKEIHNPRLLGFLFERLFTFWIRTNPILDYQLGIKEDKYD